MYQQALEIFKEYAVFCIYPVMAVILSWGLTRVCIHQLPRLGFVDLPDPTRRIHQHPIPRGGGIALIGAFFLTSIFYCTQQSPDNDPAWHFLFKFSLPALVILITGLLDDRYSLPSRLKLLGQIAAGVIIWFFGFRFESLFGIPLPGLLSLVATVFWVVAIINAFNLIDGMDGLASGLAIVAAGCMLTWTLLSRVPGHFSVYLLIFGGACLGFLRYNFAPARIFLGDTGSMFIGLFFAYISLQAVGKTVTITSLTVPLLAMGVPLLDVTLAFWRRFARKLESPSVGIMTADREHLHHRLLAHFRRLGQAAFSSGTQRRTAFCLYALGLVIALVGILAMSLKATAPALGYGLLLLVAVLILRQLAGIELFDSTRVLFSFYQPDRLLLLPVMLPLLDLLLLSGIHLACVMLFQLPDLFQLSGWLWHVAPVMLVLWLSGTYRVYWLRSGMNDFKQLLESLLLGGLIGGGLFVVFRLPESTRGPAMFLMYVLMVICCCSALRFFCWYAGGFLLCHLYLKRSSDLELKRVVLVGGGLHCRIYLNWFYGGNQIREEQVIGVIDDNPRFRHLRLYGKPVLGTSEELEELLRRYRFTRLIITTGKLSEEHRLLYQEFCRRHGVELQHFRVESVRLD